MKRKIAAGAAAVVFLAVLFTQVIPVSSRFYLGSRIKGTVTLYVDGEQAALSADGASTRHGSITADGEKLRITAKGGLYGGYTFTIDDERLGEPVTITVFQYDWHQITRFDCELYVTNGGRSVTYSTGSRTVNEFRRFHDTHSGALDKNRKVYVV